jgi:hypothetical protein
VLLNLVSIQTYPTDEWNQQQQADFIKSTAMLLLCEHSAAGDHENQ